MKIGSLACWELLDMLTVSARFLERRRLRRPAAPTLAAASNSHDSPMYVCELNAGRRASQSICTPVCAKLAINLSANNIMEFAVIQISDTSLGVKSEGN